TVLSQVFSHRSDEFFRISHISSLKLLSPRSGRLNFRCREVAHNRILAHLVDYDLIRLSSLGSVELDGLVNGPVLLFDLLIISRDRNRELVTFSINFFQLN